MSDGDHDRDLESIRERIDRGRAYVSDSKILLRMVDRLDRILEDDSDYDLHATRDRISQVLHEVETIAAELRANSVEGPATIGGIRGALAQDIARMLRRVLDGKNPLP